MSLRLEDLNPEQLAAVTLPDGHALVLAGAGSGKTRVLTTRIAWLIKSGRVSPGGVLAVTFTNKAAREMFTRLTAMLPLNPRGMWIGTFHGLCNRMLRAHHQEAGLPREFQILDQQDQLAAIKRLCKARNVDEDRLAPRELQRFVNARKEEGLRAGDANAADDLTRRFTELYAAYDEQCQREGVVDFAELLLRSYELLARNEILREHYRARFRHILVDEFQDTNRLQYRWLKLLAGPEASLFGVGDDDQCLIGGTNVAMPGGRSRPIESIRAGEQVLSCFGPADFRAATVSSTYSRMRTERLVEIRLRSGKRLVSTPEHTHFAGYVLGQTPQKYFTYLMMKRGIGFRLGTTQVYTKGQRRPIVGLRQRSMHEHADALWVLAAHDSENDARLEEMVLSLRHGVPTLPFVPRKGNSKNTKARNGLVHDMRYIRRVFESVDSVRGARELLRELDLDIAEPHMRPRSRESNRRNITVTLCADRRRNRPMHRVFLMGSDAAGKRRLTRAGFEVRPGKRGWHGWRVETVRAKFGDVLAVARRLQHAIRGDLIFKAHVHSQSVPFVRASAVRPGMVMVDASGGFDVVDSVCRLPAVRRRVYDINVEPTHNFIANGIVTHNSIYAFRGANVGNMAEFEREYAQGRVIRLEQNYRSHGTILDAANALIAHNRKRLGKNLWTASARGDPVRVYEGQSDEDEARFVTEEIEVLRREGARLADIAVLYRSNAQSRVIEHALFGAQLPYRVYGGLRFFERAEVKHALAYLRLVASPEDDNALLRVANFPPRGIGARSIETLQDAARADGSSLWQAIGSLPGRAAQPLAAFRALVEALRKETAELPLAEKVEHVVARSGLVEHYKSEREGADRVENLGELVNAAAAFDSEERERGLETGTGDEEAAVAPPDALTAFLTHAALEAGEHQAGEGQDALQLMTVHSAKGLEFDAVFLTGLEEGLFPHEQSLVEKDGLEEERRLAYVAITRARRRLYLTFAQARMLHGQTRYHLASRFLDEVPAGLMKWLTPRFASERRQAFASPAASARAAPRRTEHGLRSVAERDIGFRIGQNVTHPKFGAGVVIDAEGHGGDARVQVNFGKLGVKWLAVAVAKLEAA